MKETIKKKWRAFVDFWVKDWEYMSYEDMEAVTPNFEKERNERVSEALREIEALAPLLSAGTNTDIYRKTSERLEELLKIIKENSNESSVPK